MIDLATSQQSDTLNLIFLFLFNWSIQDLWEVTVRFLCNFSIILLKHFVIFFFLKDMREMLHFYSENNLSGLRKNSLEY